MANYTIGQLGLNLRGAYDAATTYARLDVVTYKGNSYCVGTLNSRNKLSEIILDFQFIIASVFNQIAGKFQIRNV